MSGVLVADTDGNGCAEQVRFSGGSLESGSTRWEVGQEGDVGVVGDWVCRGSRTLAVLRPATGEVFRFDAWATADRPAVAPLVARIEGSRGLRVADVDRDGCHELVIDRVDGPPAVLRAKPAS